MTVQIEKKRNNTHRVKSMIYEDAEDSYEGAFVVECQRPNELQQQRVVDMAQRKSSRLSAVYRATVCKTW